MAFLKFDNGLMLNSAHIVSVLAVKDSKGNITKYTVDTPNTVGTSGYCINKEEFEREWKKIGSEDSTKALASAVRALAQSVDRLSVRIPSSIRMHM